MAKRKSSKKSNTSLILTIVLMAFGALLFASMFLPLLTTKLGNVSSSIADYVDGDIFSDSLKAAVWLGFAGSLIGGIVFVVALVSLVMKGKLFGKINLFLMLIASTLYIASLVSTFVYIGDVNEYIKTITLNMAGFVGLGSAVVGAVLAKLKK